jgi:hypothetical protein
MDTNWSDRRARVEPPLVCPAPERVPDWDHSKRGVAVRRRQRMRQGRLFGEADTVDPRGRRAIQ